MEFNWLLAGSRLAGLLAPVVISLVVGIMVFNYKFAPSINEALLEAQTTITNLAKLGGLKSQEFTASKGLEKVVAADLIKTHLPELEALKLILSPSTWEQIEETIEENPEAVLQLYQRYGHLIPGVAQGDAAKSTDF